MAQIITIKGDKREVSSKDSAHLLRNKGSVPAIIYGDKTDPVPIALNLLDLEKEIKKQGFFSKQLQIEINGSTERVLPTNTVTCRTKRNTKYPKKLKQQQP